MKRAIALVAAFAALSCTQNQAQTAGGVSGTYDLLLAGEFIFVTSADKSELRAIDIAASPHDWMRAPNPLEVLSIPVLSRPVSLAKDLTYGPDQQEVTGPYVYAIGAARAEISVVAVDRTILKELKRIATDGPVTAISALGPGAGTQSTLYYATYLGAESKLYSVSLDPPATVEAQAVTPTLLATLPNESVLALQVLPNSGELAVATRTVGATSGRTFALLGPLAPRTLSFPGPIRALATHPGSTDADGNVTVPAQSRLFGMIDEASCGGVGCGAIWAVDVLSGNVAMDFTSQQMLPIRFTRGLPVSFTFAPNAEVRTSTDSSIATTVFPLLGIATNTDGQVIFFDAKDLHHVNTSPIIPVATQFFLLNEAGAAVAYDDTQFGLAQSTVVPGQGSAVDDTVSIIFEGPIPDLVNLPTTNTDGQRFVAANAARARAQVGDHIVLTLSDGTTCATELVVSDPNDGNTALATTDTIPTACSTRASFTVRANGAQPYVVTGLAEGYMGRVGDQQTFTFVGTAYYRPASGPPAPALTFQMRDPFPGIAQDFRYILTTTGGFTPLFFQLSTDTFNFPGYHLPHGVVHLPTAASAFVSYPSVPRGSTTGNGAVVELNPALMIPSQLSTLVVRTYR